ncbi:GntR family transcriptional regulator [Lentisalinibacter orientalis]|uniref:GntR family transcriptional regulator n=1 Tax=Lentisalinibacter orientalis TaxID=2992241 RepID=UPI003870C5BC
MSYSLQALLGELSAIQQGSLARAPLYYQLYSALKSLILKGVLPFESRLPTEQEIAGACGVSRITTKRAMDDLANDGLIARYRGKGSIVTYRYKPRPVRAPLVDVLENLIELGKHSIVNVISVQKILPPANIREELSMPVNEKIHKLIRVRSNESGEPFAYYVSFTRGIRRGFTKRNLERTPRLEVLQGNEVEVAKVEQVLSATDATMEIAEHLNVKPGTALLAIRRKSIDKRGDTVDILDGWYNPALYVYSMELSLD